MTRLTRDFFERNCVEVAQDLLGKVLKHGPYLGVITDVEAYRGRDDPASHAYRGPTPRTQVMFGPPGVSYVYLSYGMHHCLNIVTEPEGTASAVLIRGLWHFEPSKEGLKQEEIVGPGRVCRHLKIDKSYYGLDMTRHPSFYVIQGIENVKNLALPRVGITKAQDRLWRFQMVKDQDTLEAFRLLKAAHQSDLE